MKPYMNRNSYEQRKSYTISHKNAGKIDILFTIGKGQYTTLLLFPFFIKTNYI